MDVSSTPAPRAGIKAGAIVASEQAEIVGDVTIGPHCVISQACSILAIDGPIVIGDSNLIEERVEIVNKAGNDGSRRGETMYIGSDNVFEIGSVCRALKVGDNNVFEIKSHVGRDVEVTNGCIIGIKCTVDGKQTLPEKTIVFGQDCQRREMNEKPSLQTLQLDFLRKVFTKEVSLKKPGASARRVIQTRARSRPSMTSEASTPAAKATPST